MDFVVSFQTACLSFFVIQGLLFAGLLGQAGWRDDHRPSYWLAFFLLLGSLYVAPFLLGYSGWYGRDGYREVLFFVPFQQLFLLGPVIYCYTRSLLEPGFRLRGSLRWHFVPALVYLGYSLVIFVVDAFVLDEYYFYADGRDKDLATWYQVTGLLSLATYAGLSLRRYRNYRQRIYTELSYADSVVYAWVGRYLAALLAIVLLRAFFLALLPNFGSFGSWFWYYLGFGALYHYIALAGYTNAVRVLAPLRRVEHAPSLPLHPAPAAAARSGPETDAADKARLLRLMEEERYYENPSLSLGDLAAPLGLTTKQVSALVNRGFDQNFNDFVNGYRVQAVREAFARGDHERYTILSIALAAGFNSKSTFNRVFKRMTARTPVQYLARLRREGPAATEE